ncbi:MAG: DUF2029 domain-containing protein [Flavobacteriales bacterium]|nr:DUF2029 domain-containing protein [Flavobacteriales bacterium]
MKRLPEILIFLVCIAYGALNIYNGRFEMRDLQVYYDAAGQLLEGNSPYGRAFGLSSGFYKYSVSAAMVFYPAHLLGSWFTFRVIYFVLLSAAIAWYTPRWTESIRDRFKLSGKSGIAVLLVSLTLIGHFSRELLLGNVNWFLLLLVLTAFVSLARNGILAGLLIAVALVFKPHFAVILPWLVLRKEWKATASVLVSIVVLLMLPSLHLGWGENLALLNEWKEAIMAHNGELGESPNTLFGMISNLTGINGSWLIYSSIGAVAIFVLVWMLRNMKNEEHANELRFLEFAFLVAIVPNLVHTDTEHFMWTMPLIVLLAWLWLQLNGSLKWVVSVLWMLALIPYSLNTPDIWGSAAAEWFNKSGILGLANLILIVLAIGLYYRVRQREGQQA